LSNKRIYKIVDFSKRETEGLEQELSDQYRYGWELITVSVWQNKHLFYFKRMKEC